MRSTNSERPHFCRNGAAHLEGQDDDSHVQEHGGLKNASKDVVLVLDLPGVELVKYLHSTIDLTCQTPEYKRGSTQLCPERFAQGFKLPFRDGVAIMIHCMKHSIPDTVGHLLGSQYLFGLLCLLGLALFQHCGIFAFQRERASLLPVQVPVGLNADL
jgi:hypothetical protein